MALTRPRYSNIADSDFKNSCRTVTTTSITLSGGAPSSYDSLTLAVGDRLLVTAQGSSAQNGIYVVTTLGTGSNGTWTRSPDANDSSKLNAGMQVTIGEGTYAGQLFKLTTPDPINLGTTGLTFISLAGAAAGSTGQLQYNLSGSMSGAANITVNSNGNLKVTSNVELSGNLWQGNRAGHGIAYTTKSSTPPANAMVGDYWYDTSTDIRYIFHSDGVSSFWLDETTAPRSGYTFSNTPPIGPIVGDQWYDTSTDIIYERITDGTSTYWVDLTTRLGAVSGATVNSNLVAAATTISTSTTTGALVVAGGVGVAGNLNASNVVALSGFTMGSQVFYAQGTNGFSVNENYDPSNNSGQTAYHFTSGATRANIAFTLARTGQFTDGFGVYGTSADNTFVTFGEQSNTSFEWRKGIGIQPLNLSGGTQLMKLSSAGNLVIPTATASASNTTGALVVGGGAGIAGNVYVGGNLNVASYLTIGNVTTAMAKNGYNVAKGTTYANVDNVSASVFANGVPAFSSVTGTINYFWSAVTNLTGGKFFGNTSTGGAVTTLPTSIGSVNGPLASGGDTVTAILQDQDLGRAYQIIYMQTVTSGSCSIVVTRIV